MLKLLQISQSPVMQFTFCELHTAAAKSDVRNYIRKLKQ